MTLLKEIIQSTAFRLSLILEMKLKVSIFIEAFVSIKKPEYKIETSK